MNAEHLSSDVADARLDVLKVPKLSDDVVLFVTFAPGGQIKPHVEVYLAALKQAKLSTVLIIEAEDPDTLDARVRTH